MAQIEGVLENSLQKAVSESKILVVGAGGIGCELLKNIVLTGFKNIEVIDLDTIDVSNLNRQFLFQKQHVGKSKANCAREAALKFAPDANIKAHHDSVMKPEYGMSFFKEFALCLNALDNRAARSHVNRMCLAADIPLVESGTAGYLGQVTVIRKGKTECYECQPKPHQKTFPGCTIRNTPSEPIHCIVWAKHLFNQLFGEADPDEDVSPDTEDPEASGEEAGKKFEKKDEEDTEDSKAAGDGGEAVKAAEKEGEKNGNDAGNVARRSTRIWAQEHGYNTQKLFQKFFNDDIKYLLSMDKLWTKRKPPTPLDWDCLPSNADKQPGDAGDSGLEDQKVWSIAECATVMETAISALKEELAKTGGEFLVWDKDDLPALNFVTACANIRMHIFNIKCKSRFEVKSMAGNIIPAIATTNAVIAGCIVMEAIKFLAGQEDKCKTVYLRMQPNPRKRILVTEALEPPNPKCIVCAPKPEVHIKLNIETFTMGSFVERILKSNLNMVAPDVEIDGKGIILISSEEGETEDNNDKTLKELGLIDGSILSCDDFLQNYNIRVYLWQMEEKAEDGSDFILAGDRSQLQPKEIEEEKEEAKPTNGASNDAIDVDDDIVEVVAQANGSGDNKRPAEDSEEPAAKKQRMDGDEIVICAEKAAPTAEELKKAMKPDQPEDGVVCIE